MAGRAPADRVGAGRRRRHAPEADPGGWGQHLYAARGRTYQGGVSAGQRRAQEPAPPGADPAQPGDLSSGPRVERPGRLCEAGGDSRGREPRPPRSDRTGTWRRPPRGAPHLPQPRPAAPAAQRRDGDRGERAPGSSDPHHLEGRDRRARPRVRRYDPAASAHAGGARAGR